MPSSSATRPPDTRARTSKSNEYTSRELEELYVDAIHWVHSHPKPSGKEDFAGAIRAFPMLQPHTLRRRYRNEHQPHYLAHGNQMLLPPQQEDILGEWMRKDGQEGFGWSRDELRDRVHDIVGKVPSDDWIYAFDKRQKDKVEVHRPHPLDTKRAKCFNPGTVKQHFEEFNKIRENYRVICNFDETGRQRGGGRGQSGRKYYMAAGDKSNHYRQSDGNLELIMVMESCCNDGTMLDPGFIFSGSGTFSTEYWEGLEGRKISVAVTGNGWTNDDQCLQWFERVFVPQARAKTLNDDERVLLVFDGHHSHLTDAMFDLGTKYNIDFYLLPPHTTHKLQPLDVGCFGPMQRKWLDNCKKVIRKSGGRLDRGAFIRQYMEVRQTSVTEAVVKAAWRKCGLDPFNPDIFTEQDFAPSRAFSKKSFLPPSFPQLPSPVEPGPSQADVPMDVDSVFSRSASPMDVDPPPGQSQPRPVLHVPAFAQTEVPPDASLEDRVRILQQDLDRLIAAGQSEATGRVHAESHCFHAGYEIKSLKERLAEKENKGKRKANQFTSKATFLMGEDAVQEQDRQRADKAKKERQDADKHAEQQHKEREDQVRRSKIAQDVTHEFSGSLKSKKKPELQDIAFTLGLPLKATNEKLAESIRERLLSAAHYREDRRYKKLFTVAFERDSDSGAAPGPSPEPAAARSSPHAEEPPTIQMLPRPSCPIDPVLLANDSMRSPQGEHENAHPPRPLTPLHPPSPARIPLSPAGRYHPYLNHASRSSHERARRSHRNVGPAS